MTPSVIFQETRLGGPFNIDEPQGNFHNLTQARDTAEPTTQKTWLGNLTIRQVLPSFELLSSTSYYNRDILLHEDASNVLYFFFSPVPQNSVFPVGMTGDYKNQGVDAGVSLHLQFPGAVGGYGRPVLPQCIGAARVANSGSAGL